MHEEELEIIKEICEDLEEQINAVMRELLEEHHHGIITNVLVNVSTSMLAKALIMVHPEIRNHIQLVAYKAVDDKIAEGHAAVESIVAISKAKGSTCQPPKKH